MPIFGYLKCNQWGESETLSRDPGVFHKDTASGAQTIKPKLMAKMKEHYSKPKI